MGICAAKAMLMRSKGPFRGARGRRAYAGQKAISCTLGGPARGNRGAASGVGFTFL